MARAGDDVAFGLENRGVPTDEIWRRVDEALRGGRLPLRPRRVDRRAVRRRAAAAGAGRHPRAASRPAAARRGDREPRPGRCRAGALGARAACWTSPGPRAVIVEHRVEQVVDLVTRAVVLEPGGGVRRPTARRARCSGQQGAALAARGVWVPGRHPVVRRQSARPSPGPAAGHRRRGVASGTPPTTRDALPATDVAVRAGAAPRADRAERVGQVDARAVARRAAAADRRRGPRGGGAGPAAATAAAVAVARRDLVTRVGTVFQDPEHQFVTSTVRDELTVGPLRAGASAAAAARPRRRPARPARACPARRGQPVHALRRGEAPAVGGDRDRDVAPRAGGRRADLRAGRAHLGRAGRPARRAAGRRLRAGRWSPTTRRWSRRWPTVPWR